MKAKNIQKFKNIWSYVWKLGFLILFIYIIATQASKLDSTPAIIVLIIFALVVIGFYIYSELLSHEFKKSLYLLNIACDVDACKQSINKIRKYDMRNGYKGNLIVLEVLLLQDELQFNELLMFINENEQILKSSPEGILIFYYSKLKYCAYSQDSEFAKESYEKCLSLLNSKVKGKKTYQIYSKSEIEGLYQLALSKNKPAYKSFEQTSSERMNVREQVQLLYFQKLAAQRMRDNNKTMQLTSRLKEYSGTSQIVVRGGQNES